MEASSVRESVNDNFSPQFCPSREKSKRPQLSCNACRARKVKCDRVQPCTACSLHQIAELCHYDLTEAERQPILQAEALREKDKEIAHLRLEIVALGGSSKSSEAADNDSDSRKRRKPAPAGKGARKPVNIRQKKGIKAGQNQSVCFGNPSILEVIKESKAASSPCFLPQRPDSLGSIDRLPHNSSTLWTAQDGVTVLLSQLPARQEASLFVDLFNNRVHGCLFPQMSDECSKLKIDQYLSALEQTSTLEPERLALLFVVLAHGARREFYDQCGEPKRTGAKESNIDKAELLIAAACQALRVAAFMMRPSLIIVETLLMICPFLTDAGKVEESWALFGLTVRLAQAIELHREPDALSPQPSTNEAVVRKNIWWWMLHLDQQYSLNFGRPLGISDIGDCSAPVAVPSESLSRNLWKHTIRLTTLAREIASTKTLDNTQNEKWNDRLVSLRSSLPKAVRFEKSWLDQDVSLPEWPLDLQAARLHQEIHTLTMTVNGRQIEGYPFGYVARSVEPGLIRNRNGEFLLSQAHFRALEACREILFTFEFFHSRLRAGIVSWTVCEQAFNAANMLTFSMFAIGNTQDYTLVHGAYETFLEINHLGIHQLAGRAAARLQTLIESLQSKDEKIDDSIDDHGVSSCKNSFWRDGLYGTPSDAQTQIAEVQRGSIEGSNKCQPRKLAVTGERSKRKTKNLDTPCNKTQRCKQITKKSQRKDSPSHRRSSAIPVCDNRQPGLTKSHPSTKNQSPRAFLPFEGDCVDMKSTMVRSPIACTATAQNMGVVSSLSQNSFNVHSPSESPSYFESGKGAPFYSHESGSDARNWGFFDTPPAPLPHVIAPYPGSLISYSAANSLSESYPPSLHSTSHPSSTYARSTVSSLPTPLTSHPVSPNLNQGQAYCVSRPQTQPQSPEWGFDGAIGMIGGTSGISVSAMVKDSERDDVGWMWTPGWSL